MTRDQWWTKPYYEWTIAADGTVVRGDVLASDHPPIAYTGWVDLPIASDFWTAIGNVQGDRGGHAVLLPTGYLPDDILIDSAYATNFKTSLASQITDYIASNRLVPGSSSIANTSSMAADVPLVTITRCGSTATPERRLCSAAIASSSGLSVVA